MPEVLSLPVFPAYVVGSLSPAPQKLLYDRKSAAYVLSISTRSLDWLVSQKQLATRRLGKKVMITHGELVRFARADHFHLTQAPSP
ncbi:hypothetical protein AciX9_2027 [Granulicella tundricola MP5ACTX9]|uniref:Helix-turn-helix domain-containing protein n=1 Tax=Granulicella tundricola (strain ATCC BAA-1859 / DSM 23138 / MP5ACTX9) TaxID=1198114 RepID=E8X1B8_GRATM|nr:hypothetical protein AciX9_2027 [Granulicella tundricola MP5ACTX9]